MQHREDNSAKISDPLYLGKGLIFWSTETSVKLHSWQKLQAVEKESLNKIRKKWVFSSVWGKHRHKMFMITEKDTSMHWGVQ